MDSSMNIAWSLRYSYDGKQTLIPISHHTQIQFQMDHEPKCERETIRFLEENLFTEVYFMTKVKKKF